MGLVGVTSARPGADAGSLDVVRRGVTVTCQLANLRLACADDPPERKAERLEVFLEAMTASPGAAAGQDPSPVERLRTVLRCPSLFGAPSGIDERQALLVAPGPPLLIEGVVADRGSSMAWLRRDQLADLGLDEAGAFAAARANLAHIADRGITPYDAYARHPIWQVDSGDGYEASRLLLPGWLAAFADRVEGRPIAAVPHRGALLVSGDGDALAVERLARAARAEYEGSPWPISPALYASNEEGRPVPWLPPDGHPAFRRVRMGHLQLAVDEHATQFEQLPVYLQRARDRAGVAPFEVVGAADGRLASQTRWERGSTWLLPAADLVVLADDGEERTVPWSSVVAGLEREPRYDPPRWRTDAWPAEAS
jgi:hypothetical protein